MLKTNIKSFVYSFSVSLLTIMSVGRVFLHDKTLEDKALIVKNKNVSLFFERVKVSASPSKKISLAVYPSFKSAYRDTISYDPDSEIVLADNFDDIGLPVEFSGGGGYQDKIVKSQESVVLSGVVYSSNIQSYLSDGEGVEAKVSPVYDGVNVAFEGQKDRAQSKDAEVLDGVAAGTPVDVYGVGGAIVPVVPVQLVKSVDSKSVEFASSQKLNHVALNGDEVTIQSVSDQINKDEKEDIKGDDWSLLRGDPWVVARSGGTKNQMAINEYAHKMEGVLSGSLKTDGKVDGVRVASETVKNLIIPIPDEIMKKDDLTPKLAYPSSSEDASKEKIIDTKIKIQTAVRDQNLLSPIEEDVVLDSSTSEDDVKDEEKRVLLTGGVEKEGIEKEGIKKEGAEKKVGILGAINSIFSSAKKTVADAKDEAIAKARAKKISRKSLLKSRSISIMPTEIRLSFQPGRAEISGQTLRWIQAFASKAAETTNTVLEIRVDGSGAPDLQQRRMNLLYNILTHKGVEYSKINVVFTSRDPNSFVLRSVVDGDNFEGVKGKMSAKYRSDHIQW